MSITEDKTVNEETYPYIFPDLDLKVQSVFRRRNKTVLPANVAMLVNKYKRDQSYSDIPAVPAFTNQPTTTQYNTFIEKCRKFTGENGSGNGYLDTKPNASSTFTIDASENQLFRLQDAEINLVAQYAYYDDPGLIAEDTPTSTPITKPMFGNQCLLSLFQMIELRIDGIPIERNAYPGFSSNMDYALRYPHCKSLEKNYEINGFVSTDPDKYILPEANGSATADKKYWDRKDAFNSFNQQGITCQCISFPPSTQSDAAHDESTNKWTSSQVNFYTGFINQRYKLIDLFTCVKDMPTIFNHKVEVVLQRSSHNDIICNTMTASNKKCTFLGFWTYQFFEYVYETTNELTDAARAYYSKPIETVIMVKKDVQTPFIQQPTGAGNISFNLGVDPSFKNILLTLCIPRSAEMNGQFNSNKPFFDTTSTNGVYTETLEIDNSIKNRHYDAFYAPCNSYTSGGLKALTVYQNGQPLYNFTMGNDGTMRGPKQSFRLNKPNTQTNYTPGDIINCPNYQDVYKQYVRAREHFEQPENEAIDFNTFVKEYCFFCIDLSPFEISSNQPITVVLEFTTWSGDYNPYYDVNTKGAYTAETGAVYDSQYRATQIISNIYCLKVLRLNPGRSVGVYDAMSTTTTEI